MKNNLCYLGGLPGVFPFIWKNLVFILLLTTIYVNFKVSSVRPAFANDLLMAAISCSTM